jgi:hypothetical protein
MSVLLSWLLLQIGPAEATGPTKILSFSELHSEALRVRQVQADALVLELCETVPDIHLQVWEVTCRPVSRPLSLIEHNKLIHELLLQTVGPANRSNLFKFGTSNLLGFGLSTSIVAFETFKHHIKTQKPGLHLLRWAYLHTALIAAVSMTGAALVFRYMEDYSESHKAIFNALKEHRLDKPQIIDNNERSWPLFKKLLDGALQHLHFASQPEFLLKELKP